MADESPALLTPGEVVLTADEQLRLENERLRLALEHHEDERRQHQYRYLTTAISCISSVRYLGDVGLSVAYQRTADGWRGLQPGPTGPTQAERSKAEERAVALLEQKIGSRAMGNLGNGGAYPVKSKHWPDVVYYIPRNPHERVKVLQNGLIIMESCIVTTRHSLPWADVMLQRITAIEMDESVVVETGNVQITAPSDVRANRRRTFIDRIGDLARRIAR